MINKDSKKIENCKIIFPRTSTICIFVWSVSGTAILLNSKNQFYTIINLRH